jgi:hypothetical protein
LSVVSTMFRRASVQDIDSAASEAAWIT